MLGRVSRVARACAPLRQHVLSGAAPGVRQFAAASTESHRLAILEAIGTADLEKLSKKSELESAMMNLQKALEEEGIKISEDGTLERPTSRDLNLHALNNGLPFIGFGFLDNAIMILGGDFFDSTLGTAFAVSTMFACALGNMCGDVAGLFLGNSVEVAAAKLNLPTPNMSPAQREMGITRTYKLSGCVIGVMIGCTLGMFPLLYPEKYRLWQSREQRAADRQRWEAK